MVSWHTLCACMCVYRKQIMCWLHKNFAYIWFDHYARLGCCSWYCVHKILGMLGPRPHWTGLWLTRRKRLLPYMCYHIKFQHSRTNHFGIGRGSQIFGGSWSLTIWDRGVWLMPHEHATTPHLIIPNFVTLGQTF